MSEKPFDNCYPLSQFKHVTFRPASALPTGFVSENESATGESSTSLTNRQPLFHDYAADEQTPAIQTLPEKQGFQWRRALEESGTFLVIEQGYVVHTDFRWVVSENGYPFNHYWRDYMQSLTTWWRAGWSAGEDPLYNYVGHPIQGAITGYIELQNNPRDAAIEYSNTKAYWRSRLKAMLWNAVYSTQWSIGPLSEMTVEKYGSKDRPPWNANGSYPCDTKTCYWGVGKVNLVMTPFGGFGWILAEDVLDKKITERIEEHTQNRLLIDTVRCALNPIRGGANILHGNHPWYRARDSGGFVSEQEQKRDIAASEKPQPPIPSHGDVFFGYSHLTSTHCELIGHGIATACDPLSANISGISGWNTSVEKKYLRYFGIVADIGSQYGSVNEMSYLFGIRGGAWIGRFRPYAEGMVGAVHAQEQPSLGSTNNTSFGEYLGVGLDFRLARRLNWRNEIGTIKTELTSLEQRNVRVSSGLAVRF